MKKTEYSDKIHEIIISEVFRNKIKSANIHYSNLKQENLIRNIILENLNDFFEKEQPYLKAFAEHPRIQNTRVDLSIINEQDIVDGKCKEPYKVEFKYQFSGDCNNLSDYSKVIYTDFEERKSDLFILIISHWDIESKKIFDKKWGITSNLSRYISKNEIWINNIANSFNEFKTKGRLISLDKIVVELPYNSEYYIYLLSRK